MKKKSIRAAIYVRSSTKGGKPPQEVMLRQHAERSGYKVLGVYQDHGPGLGRTVRSGLDALLSDASNGKADRVLVMDVSRLGRSPNAVKQTVAALEANGVVVEVVGEAVRAAFT